MFDYIKFLQKEYGYHYGDRNLKIYGMPEDLKYFLQDNGILYPRYKGDRNIYQSFTPELFKLTYEFMKKSKKHFIYIIEDTEGYWSEFDHHIHIHRCCKKAGIPEDRIIYLNNDIHLNYRYDKWFENKTAIKKKINMITYPFLLYGMANEYNRLTETQRYELERYQYRKKLPTKHYMCLMGKNNWFRSNFWKYIDWNDDFKNKTYISFIARNILLEKDINKRHREGLLNCESSPLYDFKLNKYYQDSYVSVIPETSCGVYASEKTTKVLYHGHPFLMFCPASDMEDVPKIGMLEKLREWGFETFPELFDESYDDLPILEPTNDHSEYYNDLLTDDIQIRWKAFINNFAKIIKLDIGELHKLCESVEEKCIHNRKTLLNLKIPVEQTKKKITDIVEKLS